MQGKVSDIDIAGNFLAHVQGITGCSNANYAFSPIEIAGGYDTRVFHFRLKEVPKELSSDLVLRVYPSPSDKIRAHREACVQNALAIDGLPVPVVRMVSDRLASINAPFMVMDYISGKNLLDLEEPESSLALGRTHAMLHDHRVDRIVDRLASDGFNELFLADRLNRARESAQQFPWAAKLIDWLTQYRPKESKKGVAYVERLRNRPAYRQNHPEH